MKRHGHLWERTFTPEALHAAYLRTAEGKHAKRACFNFERRLAFNLDRLHQALHAGTYRPQPYYSFPVYEPKRRTIFAPAFCDLVVQHAMYATIYPIFSPTMSEQSFACRVGKGTHKAADYAQRELQRSPPDSYTLKLDIRKFFYRIDRDILRTLIERKIKDRRFADLLMVFADHGEPIGIPIGNLLSQLFALIYLTPLDHFVQRELRAARYCRYVDDFILFGLTRAEAVEKKTVIETFLRDRLHLELSAFSIAPRSRGVNFVGYRAWAGRRFIRKRSLFNLSRAAQRRNVESVSSILGHARRTHSLQHCLSTIRSRDHAFYHQLPEAHRRLAHDRVGASA